MLRDSLHTFMLGDDAVFSVYPSILGSPQWQSRSENIEKQSQILFTLYQFSLKKKEEEEDWEQNTDDVQRTSEILSRNSF